MDTDDVQPKEEIYEYSAPWPVYAMNWSNTEPFRLAISSFKEELTNELQVVGYNEEKDCFQQQSTVVHHYPATKLMWAPQKAQKSLLATTAEYLRIWSADPDLQLETCLMNNKNAEYCAPLTSFDWSDDDPSIIGTSSIDTTCTIWDINKQQVTTQLIAHDKEVYDMAFGTSKNIFASVGADGSVRTFDLRKLEHSTIIYESPDFSPLLRIGWNKQDDNYLAVVSMDSPKVTIIDKRVPSLPAAEIQGHNSASVNCIAWAPHSSCHICTAGDDRQALIWDLSVLPRPVTEPLLAYNAGQEVNQLQWSKIQSSWIAIALNHKMQVLRV